MRRHQTGSNVHPARSKLPNGTGLLANIAAAENSGARTKPHARTKNGAYNCRLPDHDRIECAVMRAGERAMFKTDDVGWCDFCVALVEELQAVIPGPCTVGGPKQENISGP